MKKGKLWHLGYVIAAGFLVALFVLKNSAVWGIICSMGFAGIFSVTHVNVMHEKMLEQDADYQRNIKDERNIMIREKAGNISNMLNMMLMSLATVIFIALGYIIPAIVIGVLVFVQPFILIAITGRLEKKF